MDLFGVILFLLKDFLKYGVAYPKRAKEIAKETGIALTETYLTLMDLEAKGLIWRVGKKYKYRYGLKEGSQLDYLVQLYDCLVLGHSLPSNLQIDSVVFDELLNKNKSKNKITLNKQKEQLRINKELKRIRFLSHEGREKALDECISRIIQFYTIKAEDSIEEEIINFLKKEFSYLLPIYYCAEIKGGK